MNITIIGANAERRVGMKTLVRRVVRQASFYETTDWKQTHASLKRHRPDMIVVDWTSTSNPVDLHVLLNKLPGIPTAVLIDQPTTNQVFMLMAAGATGVIPRGLNPLLVLRAIDIVTIGGHYIPPDIIDPQFGRILMSRRGPNGPVQTRRSRIDLSLSERQQQIMRCVHMGSTNKMIAKTLGISEGTVKIHLASVFQQLGATNRASAVAIFNGVQNSHLEILREGQEPEQEHEQEQKHGQEQAHESADAPETRKDKEKVVPLRRNTHVYPPHIEDGDAPFPAAAQPDTPF
jgi:DNA-binding NarL/FixJ family response regulator